MVQRYKLSKYLIKSKKNNKIYSVVNYNSNLQIYNFGKGASVPSSLYTTNSEGDRRSPEEFGQRLTFLVAYSTIRV